MDRSAGRLVRGYGATTSRAHVPPDLPLVSRPGFTQRTPCTTCTYIDSGTSTHAHTHAHWR
jgi:hypothetical protein